MLAMPTAAMPPCSTHHGSTVQVVLGSCLFAVIVASLVLACILAVQSILEAAAVPTFRLIATGNRPDLALAVAAEAEAAAKAEEERLVVTIVEGQSGEREAGPAAASSSASSSGASMSPLPRGQSFKNVTRYPSKEFV